MNFRAFAAGHCHLLETANDQPESGTINYSMRSPVGVAGLISPWNLPLYLLTFKIAPALMAGCTVVCKPSEMTTVTTWMFCKVSMISVKLLSMGMFGYCVRIFLRGKSSQKAKTSFTSSCCF